MINPIGLAVLGGANSWAPPKHLRSVRPQAIPTMEIVRSHIDENMRAGLAAYVYRIDTLSHSVATAELLALGDHLSIGDESVATELTSTELSGGARFVADDDTHDRYFRVTRLHGPAGGVFLHSMIAAAAKFHAEMDSDYGQMESERFATVAAGFASLLGRMAGLNTDPVECPALIKIIPPKSVDSMRRWVIGHQIFAALTQGIIFALEDFEAAVGVADLPRQSQALQLAADLLTASGTAFRFTADFPALDYGDVVRPTMMGPVIGEGFSGLLSSDHRHLVAVLSRLRPLLGEAYIRLQPEHEHLTQALNFVYDSHKFVCAQFGGAEKPSLRCPNSSPLPGTEQLERYQRARVGLLKPSSGEQIAISD